MPSARKPTAYAPPAEVISVLSLITIPIGIPVPTLKKSALKPAKGSAANDIGAGLKYYNVAGENELGLQKQHYLE